MTKLSRRDFLKSMAALFGGATIGKSLLDLEQCEREYSGIDDYNISGTTGITGVPGINNTYKFKALNGGGVGQPVAVDESGNVIFIDDGQGLDMFIGTCVDKLPDGSIIVNLKS